MGSFNVSYSAGGRLDLPFWPSKPIPYTKGQLFEVMGPKTVKKHKVTEPRELYLIAVNQDLYDYEDEWRVKVNGNVVVKSSWAKDYTEGIFLDSVIQLESGDEIEFIYLNNNGRVKNVTIRYQFLLGS